jgi:DNA-binding MarR family transcriptional regulator
LISRTGRYKIFPLIGTIVMTLALFHLSRLTVQSSTATASIDMLALGLGLGLVMQVLVIAVQNAVDYGDLGVATSGATLFRLIGGSLGTAILGAIFASRLSTHLARVGIRGALGASAIAALPALLRAAYAGAFTAALHTVFVVASVICAIGVVVTVLMPEHPLRKTVAATAANAGDDVAGAFARPESEQSAERQLLRAFRTEAERDVQREHIRAIVQRSGESLTPLAAWLLVRIERLPSLDLRALARQHRVESDRLAAAVRELAERELIAVTGLDVSNAMPREGTPIDLTPAGCVVLGHLVDARRAHLAELLAEWNPNEVDAATFLRGAARDLVPDARVPAARA